MTNNQICALITTAGLVTIFLSMCLMFFGVAPAWISAAIGFVVSGIGTINFD